MVEALVEHDYVAKEPNELSITKGDIIKDISRKPGGWLEGTLKEKTGLFPDNFVRMVDKNSSVVLRNRKDVSRIRQCRVVFSYKQAHEDELDLKVGDIIDILGEEEEGWWRGKLHGKQGVFPSNFVEEIAKSDSKEDLSQLESKDSGPILPSKPVKVLCVVKFSYTAQNEDELSLKEGDIVTLLSRDSQDPGWWKGMLNGVIGMFPDNFVSIISEDPPSKDENRPKYENHTPKAIENAVVSQRKSLEVSNHDKSDPEVALPKTTPPLPAKKPSLPIKKSPSGSSSGGLFSGLKKKLVDVVDGATGSKAIAKTEPNLDNENAFDDVTRRPLLGDVRASRPKAPGRRLPTTIGKDSEMAVPNGTSEPDSAEALSADELPPSPDVDAPDSKPKVREWEKHRAPWLAEMKLNQAKRTSTPETKPKLTPTEKTPEPEPKLSRSFEKEASPVDMSRSVTSKSKASLPETPVLRAKPLVALPTRPQTIQPIVGLGEPKRLSPAAIKTPTPSPKAVEVDQVDGISQKQFLELVHRISKLEKLVEKQREDHEVAIEKLRDSLEIEREMRMKLQEALADLQGEDQIQQL